MTPLASQYRSDNPWRADLVRAAIGQGRSVNGLDTIAVDQSSSTVTVVLGFLADPTALNLRPENVVIEATDGSRPFRVLGLTPRFGGAPLQVGASISGPVDSARYTLRLVSSPTDSHPPAGIDPLLASGSFAFRRVAVSGPDSVDAPDDVVSPPAAHIDYLAKDFQSLKRLMFDRMAVLRPDWQERHAADLRQVLVELLAYAADHASYYQDAVGTEAYLGTARRRISVRRHARLLDYHMHDGRNARAWVAVTVRPGLERVLLAGPSLGSASEPPQPGTQFLTRLDVPRVVPSESDLSQATTVRLQRFESMHDLQLFSANNEIPIYTWGQRDAVLAKGATRATLVASFLRTSDGASTLVPGDLLLFEERALPACPSAALSDPGHRQVVRLVRVTAQKDWLFEDLRQAGTPLELLEVEWAQEDALAFDLCLREVREDSGLPAPQRRRTGVARGNIALADHGQTLPMEKLQPLLGSATRAGYDFAPLSQGPLTQQAQMRMAAGKLQPLDPGAPASAAMQTALTAVHPAVSLSESAGVAATWQSNRDLLESSGAAQEFVVEVDDEGRAHLRFGDGQSGKRPSGALYATYRIGNGRGGNVGAEALAHVLLPPARTGQAQCQVADLIAIRNPLPAFGGEDPESIAEVKFKAPQAYRVQQRAVSAADYAALLLRHPEIRQARATRRFTGSWYTMFLYVDRCAALPFDEPLRQRLLAFLEPYRLTGHNLWIEGPRFVPLELALTVTAKSTARQLDVRGAVLATLSADELAGNRRGLFHPDGLGFGQSIYLSQILSAVMATDGVASVRVRQLRRYGENDDSALANQRLEMQSLEIPRLNFRTNLPSRDGTLELLMEGGR